MFLKRNLHTHATIMLTITSLISCLYTQPPLWQNTTSTTSRIWTNPRTGNVHCTTPTTCMLPERSHSLRSILSVTFLLLLLLMIIIWIDFSMSQTHGRYSTSTFKIKQTAFETGSLSSLLEEEELHGGSYTSHKVQMYITFLFF